MTTEAAPPNEPDNPAELRGGPHDGLRIAVFPHTHEIMMPDCTIYAYRPELTKVPRPGQRVLSIFEFTGTHQPTPLCKPDQP